MPSFDKSEIYFRDQLDYRTKALRRWLALHVTGELDKLTTARQVMLIFETAMAYCGDQLGDALKEWFVRSARRSSGFCLTCDNRLDPEDRSFRFCKSCQLAKAMKEVEDEDEDAKMERDMERELGPNWQDKLAPEAGDDSDQEPQD